MHKRIAAFAVLAASVSANDLNIGSNSGYLHTNSAQTLGRFVMNTGAALQYGQDKGYAESVSAVSDGTNRLFSGNIYWGIGLGKAFDMGLAFPLYYDMTEWGRNRSGWGDLSLSMKLNPFVQDKLFAIALGTTVTAPAGAKDRGYFTRRPSYFSRQPLASAQEAFTAGAVLVEPELYLTGNFRKVKLHLNAGGVLNTETQTSTLTASAGVGVHFTDRTVLFTESSTETRLDQIKNEKLWKEKNLDEVFWTTGLRHTFKNGIFLLGAAEIGMFPTREYTPAFENGTAYSTGEAPRWNVQTALGWNGRLKPKDTDLDSLPDKLDNCPQQAEDRDLFKDEDGCPDLDNDSDGIPDSRDTAPLSPEDKDGFEDEDGIPDLDNDSDGIADLEDKSPLSPEDKDGFEDEDGTPELDNDSDGMADSLDVCKNDPEDKDGFKDEDGCPESDNDGDGISDLDDKCPNAIGLPEHDGCPVIKEISREGLVLKGVNFETGKAVLTPGSSAVLDTVAQSLIAWVEVKVEIQGHTDSTGSAEKNRTMSQERAEAVRQYLYNKGVDLNRMTARGYGKDVPIADNKTKEGRALNRRVELRRID